MTGSLRISLYFSTLTPCRSLTACLLLLNEATIASVRWATARLADGRCASTLPLCKKDNARKPVSGMVASRFMILFLEELFALTGIWLTAKVSRGFVIG